MYKYRNFIQLIVFMLIVFLTFKIDYNPFISDDIQSIANITHVSKIEDPLYQEIKDKKSSVEEEPQNAYIDRVFKKTPGRNGVRVNVEESYKKMKKDGTYNQSLLVYEQIPPEITLKDLPPSPIYRGHPEKDMVAFMINVSWGTEHIPNILNILKENHVKATFFIEGKWAKEHAEMVKMIDEQDHVIGNHAYDHPDMRNLTIDEIQDQIQQTNNIIKAIIGKTPTLFAPPSGSFTDDVVEIAHELKMETILWTVDTIDWK